MMFFYFFGVNFLIIRLMGFVVKLRIIYYSLCFKGIYVMLEG